MQSMQFAYRWKKVKNGRTEAPSTAELRKKQKAVKQQQESLANCAGVYSKLPHGSSPVSCLLFWFPKVNFNLLDPFVGA